MVTRHPDLDHSRNQDPLTESSSLFVTASSTLASFVDDGLHDSETKELGEELLALAGVIFDLSCIFEKFKKRASPAQVQELLGLDFNSILGRLRVPNAKRLKLLQLVLEARRIFQQRGCITVDHLASLVGKLQDAAQGSVCADFFLFELRKPLTIVMHLLPKKRQRCNFLVPTFLFPRADDDLSAWEQCLQSDDLNFQFSVMESGCWGVWRWRSSFYDGPMPLGLFYGATDASKLAGGVTCAGNRILRIWNPKESKWHINILEALMPVWFLQEFGPQVAGSRGVVWVDSMVALTALNKGRSKNKAIAKAARDFKLLCLKYSVQFFSRSYSHAAQHRGRLY